MSSNGERNPLLVSFNNRGVNSPSPSQLISDNYQEREIQISSAAKPVVTGNGEADETINDDDNENLIYDKNDIYSWSTSTTNMETLMHLLKGMVGTGILAMPVAFKNGGLWLSFVCVFLFGILATHCMYILVVCGNELSSRTKKKHLDYASVMEKAFETREDGLRKWSRVAKNFVNGFLLLTQIGFCCVYTVFVAQNIRQVVQHTYPDTFSDKIYILLVSVCLAPYFMIKQLKTLAIFTTIANILNVAGLVIIFINLFEKLPDVTSRPAITKTFGNFPLFFGQAVFAFEGIGLVLPMHEKMRDKPAFLGKAGVLNFGLTIAVCLYAAMGFYGYLKFGDDSQGSVTLNLPTDNWLYLSVKLMFAISLFISCGLQFYVPVNIIWPFLVKKCMERSWFLPTWGNYVFRVFLLMVICGFSVLVPHLGLLISLVGAFAGSFLAFIFPPLIELVTFKPTVKPTVEPTVKPTVEPTVEPTVKPTVEPTVEPTVKPTVEPTVEPTVKPTVEPTVEPTVKPTVEPTVKLTVTVWIKNVTIMLIGFVGFLTGTYASMKGIINKF